MSHPIPLWIKLPYTLLALIILPVYWYHYGPANFLWFSDIAFFVMAPTLWFKNRLVASMMAIGVLPLEILWMASFFSGGAFLGMANYMFDPELALWLRALSLFHFPMPAVIIYMIWRFGYDARALYPQIILSIVVILLTHALTLKVDNVNMIYPPQGVENVIYPAAYMYAMPLTLVLGVIIPMHFLLKHFFRRV
jgi:hypothetical protein